MLVVRNRRRYVSGSPLTLTASSKPSLRQARGGRCCQNARRGRTGAGEPPRDRGPERSVGRARSPPPDGGSAYVPGDYAGDGLGSAARRPPGTACGPLRRDPRAVRITPKTPFKPCPFNPLKKSSPAAKDFESPISRPRISRPPSSRMPVAMRAAFAHLGGNRAVVQPIRRAQYDLCTARQSVAHSPSGIEPVAATMHVPRSTTQLSPLCAFAGSPLTASMARQDRVYAHRIF
jgi:hypothetical protein